MAAIIAAWLLVAVGGCSPREPPLPQVVSLAGETMGTWYSIKLAALPAGTTAEALQREIDARLEEINRQMSTYLPDSEVSRFNRSAESDWFAVSPDTALVVATALQVSRDSGGAFDITVGPLVNLWNFGPQPQPRRVPATAEIAAALARVGYQRVEVRQDPPALRKTRTDVSVDLSAIAKGFAVDAVAELLGQRGVTACMVEIGGEVRAAGRKPDGTPWRIGIERPLFDDRALQHVLALEDRSLATSGDYRNSFEWQGRRYSHEIDPHTGWPVDHGLASASVLADNCMLADAWATACMVLGPEQAFRCAVEQRIDVLLMVRQGEHFTERMTPGFTAILRDAAP